MKNDGQKLNLATNDYRSIVEQCAETSAEMIISNRYIDHAAILFSVALKHTKEVFEVFTGSIPELFVSLIKNDLRDAAARGVKISIISVLQPKDKEQLAEIQQKYGNNVSFSVLDMPLRGMASNLRHFYVSDQVRYRIEEPHPLGQNFKENPNIEASASFNSPVVAQKLHDMFLALQKTASICTLSCNG
jgi:hypothetical protein